MIISTPIVRNDSGITLIQETIDKMPPGWHELPEYRESWEARNNDEASRTFEGPWGSRKAFIDWALGFAVPGPSITGVSRVPPTQHPEYPWLYCHAVRDVRGQGKCTNNPRVRDSNNEQLDMIAYFDGASGSDELSCRLTLHYAPLDYEVRTDAEMLTILAPDGTPIPITELYRYVERRTEFGLRSLPIPSTADNPFIFVDPLSPFAGEAVNQGSPLYMPTRELHYILHGIPDPPIPAFNDCQGKVNYSAFDAQVLVGHPNSGAQRLVGMLPEGYPPETLLCQTPHITRQRGPTGRVQWDVDFAFSYLPQGWNNFPAPDGNFYRGGFKSDGRPLYPSTLFENLFLAPNVPNNAPPANVPPAGPFIYQ